VRWFAITLAGLVTGCMSYMDLEEAEGSGIQECEECLVLHPVEFPGSDGETRSCEEVGVEQLEIWLFDAEGLVGTWTRDCTDDTVFFGALGAGNYRLAALAHADTGLVHVSGFGELEGIYTDDFHECQMPGFAGCPSTPLEITRGDMTVERVVLYCSSTISGIIDGCH